MSEMSYLNSFFKDGVVSLSLSAETYSILENYILSENYITNTLKPEKNKVFSPDWDCEIPFRSADYHFHSMKYIDIIQNEIESRLEFDFWRKNYGKFNAYHVMINKMYKPAKMNWHWDGFDSTFLQVVIYFGDLPNGTFLTGLLDECTTLEEPNFPHFYPNIHFDKITDRADFISIKEHNLQKNNMLVLNNLNPLMVHEIGAVEKDTARYALVYGIGYSYNFKNNFLNYDTEIFLH